MARYSARAPVAESRLRYDAERAEVVARAPWHHRSIFTHDSGRADHPHYLPLAVKAAQEKGWVERPCFLRDANTARLADCRAAAVEAPAARAW